MIFQSWSEAISQLPVTKLNEADIWRDIIRINVLPAFPANTIIKCHLVKQFENPSSFDNNIALLKQWILRPPGSQLGDGTEILMTCGGNGAAGQIGSNITRDEHYDSKIESCRYALPIDIVAGYSIIFACRAKCDYTGSRVYMQVWDKTHLWVEVITP